MKKAIFLLLSALLLMLCAFAPAEEQTYTYGDFTYALLEDGGAKLISYNGPEGDVVIPNTLDGHPVVAVGSNPFWDGEHQMTKNCRITVSKDHPYLATINGVLFGKTDKRLIMCPPTMAGDYAVPDGIEIIGEIAFVGCKELTGVTIPDSVTQIEGAAFALCQNLTSVKLPNGLASIENETFFGCARLTAVNIPESVTDIGQKAFSGCSGLHSVKLPDGMTSIEFAAFSRCTGLTDITIPNSVTSIGWSAFAGCTGLTEVIIPNTVTTIGDHAFSGCTGLTKVKIPDSVTMISNFAFSDCTGLTKVKIPDGVTMISSFAFSGCTGLTRMEIPDSVTDIGDGVFAYCSNLSEIVIDDNNPSYMVKDSVLFAKDMSTLLYYSDGIGKDFYEIPRGVKQIAAYAFGGCASLTGVAIPDSVTGIANYAFNKCVGLTSVTIPDSVTFIGFGAFVNCTNLKTVTIPESITAILDNTFFGCSSLTDVIIPKSVTTIGSYAFGDCKSLQSLAIPASVEKLNDNAFIGCENLVLSVFYNSEAESFCRRNNLAFIYIPFTYEVIFDGTARITHYDGGEENVIIPSEIDGYTVTRIYEGTFAQAPQVKSIDIPISVTLLEDEVRDAVGSIVEMPEPVSPTPTPEPPTTYRSGPFRGCSKDLVIICDLGSYAARYCEENNIPFVIREQDYADDDSWLN